MAKPMSEQAILTARPFTPSPRVSVLKRRTERAARRNNRGI